MSSRLALLFVSDQSHLYSKFILAFTSAGVEVLLARNLQQAEAILLKRAVHGILLPHDRKRDDRQLATQLKRITPRVPIFLLTDQTQPKQRDIDSIWHADFADETITRAIATFFSQVLQPSSMSGTTTPMSGGVHFLSRGVGAQGSK